MRIVGAVIDKNGNLGVPSDDRTAYQMLGSWAVAKDDGSGSKEMHVVYASLEPSPHIRRKDTVPTVPFS